MKITVRVTEGIATMSLSGRMDAHVVPELRRQLEDATSRAKGKVVLNLADVNFIDSSGLASLVQGMKHCREQGGDLHLCCLAQPVRIIFELTRLDKAFELFPAEEDAIEAFALNTSQTSA